MTKYKRPFVMGSILFLSLQKDACYFRFVFKLVLFHCFSVVVWVVRTCGVDASHIGC